MRWGGRGRVRQASHVLRPIFGAAKATLIAYQSLKKVAKVQPGPGEKETAKAVRLVKVEAAKEELNKAKIAESTFACLAYDLFRILL